VNNELATVTSVRPAAAIEAIPAVIADGGPDAVTRFAEYFTAQFGPNPRSPKGTLLFAAEG